MQKLMNPESQKENTIGIEMRFFLIIELENQVILYFIKIVLKSKDVQIY